ADGVIRGELARDGFILDLKADERFGQVLQGFGDGRVEDWPHTRLVGPVQARPVQLAQQRVTRIQGLLERGIGALVTGNDPGRGPLEDIKLLHVWGDFRYVLDGRTPGTDGDDMLAFHVVVVVPASTVKQPALEAFHA